MNLDLLKTLLYFTTGGFLVFLAITVTRDNFVNRLNRVTGAMLLFAGLGPICLALGSIIDQAASGQNFHNTAVYQLHTVWEFFFPTLLIFALVFPVDRLREFRSKRLPVLIFVPQVVHLIIMLFFSDINKLLQLVELDPSSEGFATLILKPFSYLFTGVLLVIGFVRSYEQSIFAAVNFSFAIAAVYALESGSRFVREPRVVSQTKTVLWGVRLGLGAFVLATLIALLRVRFLPEQTGPVLIMAGVVVGSVLFAIAIIRFQFLDVQSIFRQSFIYTLASAVLVGVYVVLGLQSKQLLTPLFGERAETVSYVFMIFALLLFQPISSWLDNIIRSMFIRTRTDYRNIIERFSRQVISIFEPERLRRTCEETLKTALLVEDVYFVIYDYSIGEYALLPSDQTSERKVIDREDLMLRGINLLDAPTHYSLLSDYEEGSALAEQLKGHKVKLIVPMKDAEHLLGFLALTSKAAGYRYSAEDFNLLGVLANQMVTSLTNARLYVESLERLRLQEEVNMARQIQLDLLPSTPPQLPCLTICASSIPSRTVGGDFYDFVPIDDGARLGIVIADASGKGMPAALMMAQMQAMIRSEVHNGNSISTMLKNVNQQVVQTTSAEKFVTLFYGELNTQDGLFSFSNAGHNYPILVRAGGAIELLETGGPIIGAFPDIHYTSETVQLNPDDMLFFFTDGLSEAMDAQGKEYGEERVREFVSRRHNEDPQTLVDTLLNDMRAHDPSWPPQDDTTIIALKMHSISGADNGR
ncbi:MAG TPA: GAF domain-containing SpoIIE family protein phosphatase [Candidatus Acidoferrum sp.]|nr:GAF domain-containing SpoIIE family protein phosphatase [Candidatus Acidoferrum sp.]